MPKAKSSTLADALRDQDLAVARSILKANPAAARSAQAVCAAAGMARADALELLLKHGADLNASYRNYRPLHALIQGEPMAAPAGVSHKKLSCMRWMLANGADPEQLGGWPAARAVITAAFAGEAALVEALRKTGAAFDGFVAAALGDIRYVKRILARDPGFATARDPGGLTALHCAAGSRLGARNDNIGGALLSIARLLLDDGGDPGATVRSWGDDVDAAYFAVSSGQREVFALLLERGADPSQALTPAVWKGAFDLAELALAAGGRLDLAVDAEKPLLNQLIRWGQFKQAVWMLDRGASPNVPDQRGWTAVHQAVSRGNERMLRAVLGAGGDPRRETTSGVRPVDLARERGRSKLTAILQEE